jgi:hypothetical protein
VNEDEFAAYLGSGQVPDGADDADGGLSRQAAEDLRDLLADEAMWAEPAPGGADALMAAIRAESSSPQAAPAALAGDMEDMDVPRHRAQGRGRGRSRAYRATPAHRWRLTVVAAAAAVVLVAGLAAVLVRGTGDERGGQEFAIEGTPLAPEASAIARVEVVGSGAAIELEVERLPQAGSGRYYQAWVKGPAGLVTVGTFHMRGGDDMVELWAGVDLERYPTLTVTIQEEGAGQESSGQVVLTGEIVP